MPKTKAKSKKLTREQCIAMLNEAKGGSVNGPIENQDTDALRAEVRQNIKDGYYSTNPHDWEEMKQEHYFAVVGRILGDDEDCCVVVEAESADAARFAFRNQLKEDDFDRYQTAKRNYGEPIAITHVLKSTSPIELL